MDGADGLPGVPSAAGLAQQRSLMFAGHGVEGHGGVSGVSADAGGERPVLEQRPGDTGSPGTVLD